ncbi:hypothetical protein CDAR_252781 [Caerostris darwini]|uniref:histone acetyltransferase n=1 Tax=Caerostris darwini TaxID=1538125 RepID=A0AAV4Q548_9ARAC|nr:hypothetical protein CDAR_252781 [Caerostris darwini]
MEPSEGESFVIDAATDNSEQTETYLAEISRSLQTMHCVLSLEHASRCRDDNCGFNDCSFSKELVAHARNCQMIYSVGCEIKTHACEICRRLVALSFFHAKSCEDSECLLPFCCTMRYLFKKYKIDVPGVTKTWD